ncbi:MAG: type II secretion system F family protein [Burkholderiales bacterium]|nr:type II secretion system F family protein [Burkholderiales bacterium]
MNARSLHVAKAALFQQLANAARHGLPLAEVARALVDDEQWPRAARAGLQRVAARMETGDPLSAAIAAEPALFASATAELVRRAEALAPGEFAGVLAALAADARRLGAARRAVAVTLTWPLTLGALLLAEFGVCAFYIRPSMQEAFDAMRAPAALPAPANAILDGGWLWLLPVYLVILLWYRGWLPRAVLDVFAGVADAIPFVDRWRETWDAGRLLAWLPLCQAQPELRAAAVAHVGATGSSARARAVSRRLDAAFAERLPLVEALGKARALPARMVLLARLGERAASLPDVLADLRQDAADGEALAFARFERGCVVLSYTLIGVAIALLLIGIYLPVLKIGTLI